MIPGAIMGSLQELDDVFFNPINPELLDKLGEMSHVFLA